MLSRGKIRGGNARYYPDTVATGIEDYMTGAGEAPGRWDGTGAAVEDLDGEVTAEHIERLFEGADARHPLNGEILGRHYDVADGVDKVMGWDLTVSAPKSFSILWAVADPDTAKVLDQIHAAAVRETIAYLEQHAAFSRMGRGGVAQVDTKGLLIARFEHRTSRAMDPQRHSHLLVSNRVRCTDGVWRSVDSRAAHPQFKPAGTVYHAALRAEAMLAGTHAEDYWQIKDLFEATLAEFEIELPGEQEALWRLARHAAQQIVDGELQPAEGASWIWANVTHKIAREGGSARVHRPRIRVGRPP